LQSFQALIPPRLKVAIAPPVFDGGQGGPDLWPVFHAHIKRIAAFDRENMRCPGIDLAD